MKSIKFATAINCIDGRAQTPVIEWLRKKYSVDYVDMITEPGVNRLLAENEEKSTTESLKRKVEISISKHSSNLVAIVGHYDCAANPVERDKHLEQIRLAAQTVRSWNFGAQVLGLWVNEKWQVEEVE